MASKTTKDVEINVGVNKKGKGAKEAQRELDGLGKQIQRTSSLASQAAVRTAALAAKQEQLGRSVARGKMSVEEAAAELDKFKAKMEATEKATDGVNKKTESSGGILDSIKEHWMAITVALGAAYAAVESVKKIWEFGKEGAQLQQLTQSFELMNAEVYKAPTLLEDMRQATRNTVTDAGLMSGILTLTAGASENLASQMAQAAPRLAEIAKAAQKLNPTLGDTEFLYNSIATGIKRSSPLILDNLGLVIKVGEANETMAAALGKSVDEMTAEEKQLALLNATMRAGDRLIEQVGGNVDSMGDSYMETEAAVQQLTDEIKIMISEAIGPAIKAIAELMSMGRRNREEVKKHARAWQGSTKDMYEYGNELGLVANDMNSMRQYILSDLTGKMRLNQASIKDTANQTEVFAKMLELVKEGSTLTGEELADMALELFRTDEAMDAANIRAKAMTDHYAKLYGWIDDTGGGLHKQLTVWEQYQQSLLAGNNELDAWGRNTAIVDKTAELIDTREEAARVREEIRKINEAWSQTFFHAAETAQDETVADLEKDFLDIAAAAGLGQEEIILLAGALGVYTEEQIEAALEMLVLKERMRQIAEEIANGNLEWWEGVAAIKNYIWELENIPDAVTTRLVIEQSAVAGPTRGGSAGTGMSGEFEGAGAHGFDFVIPPGYHDDSYRIMASTGERVIIQTKEDQLKSQTGSVLMEGDSNTFYVTNRMAADYIAHQLDESKRQRYMEWMGRG